MAIRLAASSLSFVLSLGMLSTHLEVCPALMVHTCMSSLYPVHGSQVLVVLQQLVSVLLHVPGAGLPVSVFGAILPASVLGDGLLAWWL